MNRDEPYVSGGHTGGLPAGEVGPPPRIPSGAALRPVGSPDPHAVRRAIGATLDKQCGYMPSSVRQEAISAAVVALDRWFGWSTP